MTDGDGIKTKAMLVKRYAIYGTWVPRVCYERTHVTSHIQQQSNYKTTTFH